ncbi:hypothetical protein ACHRV1_10940 [Flavobacterium aquidurense]|uniref:hypothetical protein n=1 Tax=Flavobacterium aquidurense TaxID=362413 RepID=UPI0037565A26
MQFKNYIRQLSISEDFKNQILNPNFISSNPLYYQNYPSLFARSFSISATNLDLLDIAGYLYYQATLFTDSLIDEGDIAKFPLINICQEESVKILTSIYGLESNFWKFWNFRRNEYLQAIYLEKSFLQKKNITIEEYEELADKKSAFGKVAIDCLYNLDNRDQILYDQLLLSHKYFSTAFQLNDDIQDFKIDVKKGQFNWAHYLLKQQDVDSKNIESLEKYLYIRGISREMYCLGISYCEKALRLVENIIVPDWIKVLQDTKKSFVTAIREIDNYLEILKALKFLIENAQNHLWSYNSTWIEDADSTNFALLSLLQNDVEINNDIIRKWLKYQNVAGGFSTYYDEKHLVQSLNDKNIKDVSGWINTHNCVSAVSFYFLALDNIKKTSFTKLKNYFDVDFEKKINSYWWTNSIYTLNYLAKTYYLLEEFEKLNWIIEKIEKIQNVNGSFSDKYGESTFYTALAAEILLLGNNSKLKAEKAIFYLIENQYTDGSWNNSNALQVPNSKSIKPYNSVYPVSSFGMNVRAKEFNRLFTTVSVLKTLTTYDRKFNS